MLWQAHAGQLWHRFTTTLTRDLAAVLGVPGRRFREHARLSYAKVAEYQRRGLVHFHAVIRLDGPDGPTDPPRPGWTGKRSTPPIRHAARSATVTAARPDGSPLLIGWGTQLDLRPVTPTAAGQLEDDTGQISDTALAGYIAKYATKTTGTTARTRPAHPRRRPHRLPRRHRPPPPHDPNRVAARRTRPSNSSACGGGRTCSASAATSPPSPAATPPPSPTSANAAGPGA